VTGDGRLEVQRATTDAAAGFSFPTILHGLGLHPVSLAVVCEFFAEALRREADGR
jgi:hypothetical protein